MNVPQELPSAPPAEDVVAHSSSTSRLFWKMSMDSFELDTPSAPLSERPPYLNPISQIELTVSARSLLNLDQITQSDPLCVIYLQDSTTSGEWIELGRTETIYNNLNPEWKTKFIVDYRFEERQMLALMIYDKDDCAKYSTDNHDFLGKLECSLGEVVSAPHSRYTRPLKLPSVHSTKEVKSTVTIACKEIGECKKILRFHMIFAGLDKNSYTQSTPTKIFVDISKQTTDGSWVLLHRTDRIPTAGVFQNVNIRMSSICYKGNVETILRFQLYACKNSFKGKSSKLVGEFTTNFIELTEKCSNDGSAKFELHLIKNPFKREIATEIWLEILKMRTETQKTFMDYLQEGMELTFAVAIDFTGSNGEPTRHSSLHYRHGKKDNPYVTTLKILDDIMRDYSSTKELYAYGFGAKGYPVSNRVNHKFALNFKETNPICQGIEGVLTAYYRASQRVKLFGPTCFAPVIREVTQVAKNSMTGSSAGKYFVLFILTDGIVCDPDTTRDALVEASNAPLSIIIIGIGDEDFTAMEKLDSDEKLLKSRSNKRAARDIVQFVELKKFINFKSVVPISEGSKIALARSVFAELPQQVVSWKNLEHGVV